jgi:PhnB protein
MPRGVVRDQSRRTEPFAETAIANFRFLQDEIRASQSHPNPGGIAMQLEPYLFFDGRCEEAIEFYRTKLGAEVTMLMRYKDTPEPHQPGMIPPGAENKVMHASLRIGNAAVLASDGRSQGRPSFQGFALSVTASDEAEAERLFAALGDGGQVQMPMAKTFFSPRFGMVADRFGVSWMVYVAP